MDNGIEIGDVVRLISGGPRMTVERIGGESVGCIWFARRGHSNGWDGPFREVYDADLLVKVADEQEEDAGAGQAETP